MESKLIKAILVFIASVLASFAAPQAMAQSYYGQMSVPGTQARADLNTRTGVVLDIQQTTIDVPASTASRTTGTIVGGLLGAVAGRNAGWQGQAAAASIGGLLGERVGNHVGTEQREATQVVIMLPNKQLITIVQEMPELNIKTGDTVFLIGQYPAVRVVRAPSGVM